MPPETPTVFVVDDDPAMRDSLRWLLGAAGHAVETFPDAESFLAAHDLGRPGCLVLDVRMPGTDGVSLQEEMARAGTARPTIVITGHAEVALAVRAVRAGALDYLEKPFDDAVLLERVQQAIDQDERERAARLERAVVRQRLATLSPREREVLELVVAGRSNKEVASELGLSPKTVEVHRARVMEKMGAGSLPQLVRMALLAR